MGGLSKPLFFASIFLLVISRPARAAVEAVFSDTTMVTYYRGAGEDKHIVYDYNRLRADMDVKDSLGRMTVKAVADLETYFSESFIGSDAYQLVEGADPDLPLNPYLNVLESGTLFARFYLYRLYAEFKEEKDDLTLGLQRIPFGVGRLWNPADTFNPIDAMSVEPQERRGVFALNYTRHLTDFSSLQAVSNFGEKMRLDKYGLRYKGYRLGMDLCASLIKSSSFFMAAAELEANLFDTGIEVRGEAVFFNNDDLDKRYFSGVAGAEYCFPGNLTLLAEYFYNGLGDDEKEEYTSQILVSGNWNYSRHYLGASAAYEVNPLTTISLASVVNLLDGSFYTGPAVSYSISDETTLNAGVNVYTGGDTDEFGGYYDNLYYLKIESYF